MHNTPPSPFLQRSAHTTFQSGVVDDEWCSIGLALVALEIVVMVVSVCKLIVVSVVGISVSLAGAAAAVVVAAAAVVVVVLLLAIDSGFLECAYAMDVVVEFDIGGKYCTKYKFEDGIQF